MSRRITSRAAAGLALASFVAITVACGSRGPLDDDGPIDAATGAVDALPGDTAPIIDAAPPPKDGPSDSREGGTIIECGSCLIGQCGADILKCVQATGCRTTLQCVATTCLAGGNPDPACLFKCAAGDVSGALQIFQIFQCVTGKCGADCGSVLGGLLGGGGGGGGGGKDAGKGKARQDHPFAQVLYSHWPELSSR